MPVIHSCKLHSLLPSYYTLKMSSPLANSFEDERQFREIAFKWTIAWDTKDLSAFVAISAPEIVADYREYLATVGEIRTKPEIVFKSLFGPETLGNPNMKTQHLLGAQIFTRISETEAKGNWQARANHVRTFKNGRVAIWDSSAIVELTYVKIDGQWKLGGWRPHTQLSEIGAVTDVMGKFDDDLPGKL
ncbi:hypothetical protein GQ44DRAFT_827028 [Phaeosphaeriaceae sp. PMI808]|nr:hypothetical protein GQ44DRAFT_827028 [Phaeosphaeriaceae sp. PMI808]